MLLYTYHFCKHIKICSLIYQRYRIIWRFFIKIITNLIRQKYLLNAPMSLISLLAPNEYSMNSYSNWLILPKAVAIMCRRGAIGKCHFAIELPTRCIRAIRYITMPPNLAAIIVDSLRQPGGHRALRCSYPSKNQYPLFTSAASIARNDGSSSASPKFSAVSTI